MATDAGHSRTSFGSEPNAPRVGAFGKMRAHGDYVRLGVPGEAGRVTQRLLLEGMERLSLTNAELPGEPVHFVLPSESAQSIAVGSFVPSHDTVGRRFPLAIYVELPWHVFGTSAVVPIACDGFLASAVELLRRAGELDSRDLQRSIDGLPLPDAGLVAAGRARCDDALRTESGAHFLERTAVGTGAYALETLRQACEPLRARPPGRADVVLDCPIAIDVDLFAWLELTTRLLAWSTPLAFLWTEESPRLLVSLGNPRPTLLPMLARRGRDIAGLWPLITENAIADQRALERWGDIAQAAAAADVRLGALFDSIAPLGSR